MSLLRLDAMNPWRNIDWLFSPPQPDESWMPAFDTTETDSEYALVGDLPGLERKAIEIRVEDGVLTIRGERKRPEADDNTQTYRLERRHGRFARTFRLPENANPDEIKAKYENGVLDLRLAKHAPVDTSRLIPVK